MLKTPDGKFVPELLPHKDEYDQSMKRLSQEEQDEVKGMLLSLIATKTYHNSAVLGAKNLESNVRLKEILLKAVDGKGGEVGLYFGLYLYATFMEMKEEWTIKRCSPEGRLDVAGYDYYKGKKEPKSKYLAT